MKHIHEYQRGFAEHRQPAFFGGLRIMALLIRGRIIMTPLEHMLCRPVVQSSWCPEILGSYTAKLMVEYCTELKVGHFFEDDHKIVGVVTSPYKEVHTSIQ